DMKRTGYIQTDHARFNRLYENVVWGQKGNFVDVPTDCPQRDERLGGTGDLNAFCTTAAYNYDIRLFMKKWLADLRNDQSENGFIPDVAPDILAEGNRGTAALWHDAIVMVPWKLYKMYGDSSYLADNYGAMTKFLAAREANCETGLIARGFEYGDWLALDKEVSVKESPFGRTDAYFLSSVFYAEDLRIVAAAAKLLGKHADEKKYIARREKLIEDIRREYFTLSGRFAIDTVTAQAVALYFNIVEDKHRARLAKELNENVLRHDCHMTTGFIGSPYVLFALADNGYFETAEKVLFNGEFPGWLYEVDMGATTIWERWNSLLPSGMPNPDGMNSYNHYAYGSVMEFVYRRIAGIEAGSAGFSKVKIAPKPVKELNSFYAEYNSVHGKISVAYKINGGKITYTVEIPEGAEGEIYLPEEGLVASGCGRHEFVREWSKAQE
ncbi:MAG: alfa-L-rhamnosidase, partial [Clostridiales bacterium]|nr:alfa-L-rhamnosidase [Clostridiales bacterium]